jgi:hypothetical protein
MAKADMIQFLNRLKGELRKNSDFRSMDANVAQNIFYFSPKLLIRELAKEFKHRNVLGNFSKKYSQSLHTFLEDELGYILERLRAVAKKGLANRTKGYILKGNQHYMAASLQTEINKKTGKGFDNFTKLKRLYTEEMNDFTDELIEHLEEGFQEHGVELKKASSKKGKMTEGDQPIQVASDLLEGGHKKKFQILESKIQASINSAFKAYKDVATVETMNANLKALGVDLKVSRNDKSGIYKFSLQSRWDNQQDGRLSAIDSKKFKYQLEEALRKLGGEGEIAKLKGSPSLKDIKDNKVLVSTLEPFDKLKDVKTTKPKIIKPKKRAPAKLKGKTKPKKSLMNSAVPIVRKVHLEKAKGKASASPASNMLQYIAMINKELPDTVKKNMREPALVNRTGRFAESVRLTDIVSTPRGFPSVGYTYQKNPYQVFEDGAGSAPWANGKRDPRKLIDKSIREIATQLAIGRFFTRRV